MKVLLSLCIIGVTLSQPSHPFLRLRLSQLKETAGHSLGTEASAKQHVGDASMQHVHAEATPMAAMGQEQWELGESDADVTKSTTKLTRVDKLTDSADESGTSKTSDANVLAIETTRGDSGTNAGSTQGFGVDLSRGDESGTFNDDMRNHESAENPVKLGDPRLEGSTGTNNAHRAHQGTVAVVNRGAESQHDLETASDEDVPVTVSHEESALGDTDAAMDLGDEDDTGFGVHERDLAKTVPEGSSSLADEHSTLDSSEDDVDPLKDDYVSNNFEEQPPDDSDLEEELDSAEDDGVSMDEGSMDDDDSDSNSA